VTVLNWGGGSRGAGHAVQGSAKERDERRLSHTTTVRMGGEGKVGGFVGGGWRLCLVGKMQFLRGIRKGKSPPDRKQGEVPSERQTLLMPTGR